jgi:hypothetical protein
MNVSSRYNYTVEHGQRDGDLTARNILTVGYIVFLELGFNYDTEINNSFQNVTLTLQMFFTPGNNS